MVDYVTPTSQTQLFARSSYIVTHPMCSDITTPGGFDHVSSYAALEFLASFSESMLFCKAAVLVMGVVVVAACHNLSGEFITIINRRILVCSIKKVKRERGKEREEGEG